MFFANQIKNPGSVDVTDYFMISTDKVVCVTLTHGGQFQFGDENKEMNVRNTLSCLLFQPTNIKSQSIVKYNIVIGKNNPAGTITGEI